MAYTKQEIKVFEDKELRIVRQAIMKKLIEKLPLEDIYGVIKVNELTERFVDHVYSERSTKRGRVADVGDDTEPKWGQVAEGLNLAIPNRQNIKILNQIADEYKKAYKASANPTDILVHIINTFGEYPENTKSVEKVIKSLTET